MTWTIIAQLIIRYGIEGAYKIWAIAKEGDPTEEAWEKLKALSLKTYDEYIAEAQQRAAALSNAAPDL